YRSPATSWTRVIWGAYYLLAFGFTARATFDSLAGMGDGFAAVVNAFQVSIGLLLLSISSAAGLADERSRGTMEVLLTTPVATRQIVRAKWWGTFRGVIPLVVLPAALIGFCCSSDYPWLGAPVLLMAVLVLSYGAAVTSVGIAAATW